MFHTFSCHSHATHSSWLRCDHNGILFALFGTYVAFVCDAFACHPGWKSLHLTAIVALFCAVVLLKIAPGKKTAMLELALFLGLGLYVLVPLGHWAAMRGGVGDAAVAGKLTDLLVTYGLAAVGLVFYVTRFPEKVYNRGAVDIVGASHQVLF